MEILSNKPSVKETWILILSLIVWLIITTLFVGFRPEHGFMALLIAILFFASQETRKLVVALLPFALFGISYDWMRIIPNYEVNPIDIRGLYETEKSLFGRTTYSQRVFPDTPLSDTRLHGWNILSLLGSGSYSVRIRTLSDTPTQDVFTFRIGFPVCQSDWFRRLLHTSGSSTLVRHELRFRTDFKHTW